MDGAAAPGVPAADERAGQLPRAVRDDLEPGTGCSPGHRGGAAAPLVDADRVAGAAERTAEDLCAARVGQRDGPGAAREDVQRRRRAAVLVQQRGALVGAL